MLRGTDRERDGGFAMVEFALVAPLLVLLFIGILEFGLVFKDKLLVNNAIQVAARTGASLGQADDADKRILEALEQGLAGLPNAGDGIVLQAQVYRVTSSGGVDTTKVNTYTYNYQGPGLCNWLPSCPSTPADHGPWKPGDREVIIANGLDTIGVRVFYGHSWVLGDQPFLPDTTCGIPANCLTETAVMRLEPQES